MSAKHRLRYSLRQRLKLDNSGSMTVRYDRLRMLLRFANDVVKLGYKIIEIRHLQPKHIQAVVGYWQKKQLSPSTLKNRLSVIRHLAKLINSPSLVPTNKELDIGARKHSVSKNHALVAPDFSNVKNIYVRVSLQLQQLFGLRRDESFKIKPHLADKGDNLQLLPSWCRNGKGRIIPIHTQEQRNCLERAKLLAERIDHSLVLPDKNYIEWRRFYDKHVTASGLHSLYGLRHAYAQQRYKELTGWEAPINGGPAFAQLTNEQKQKDRHAREVVAEEMGNSRGQVVTVYLGK